MRANRKINKSKTNNDINNETENQAIWKLEIKKDSVTKEKEKKTQKVLFDKECSCIIS